MDFEGKYPYIAAIMSGLLGWMVALFYVQEYLWIVTLTVVASLLVFRFNPWAFLGSVFAGIAIELATKSLYTQLWPILIVLIIGSVMDVVSRLIKSISGYGPYASPLGRNVTFGWIGLIFSFFAQYIITSIFCPSSEIIVAEYGLEEFHKGLYGALLVMYLCQVDLVIAGFSQLPAKEILPMTNFVGSTQICG